MSAIDVLQDIVTIIQAGKLAADVVDIVSDIGTTICSTTKIPVDLGNGSLNVLEGVVEKETGLTTGAALLTTDVGVAGAAIAPALGVLAGVGLYNLAPEFWTDVSNALLNAGKTIGGKVITFIDNSGNVTYDIDTINIYKNYFIQYNLYNNNIYYENIENEMYSCELDRYFQYLPSTPNTIQDIIKYLEPYYKGTFTNEPVSIISYKFENNEKLIISDIQDILDYLNSFNYYEPKKAALLIEDFILNNNCNGVAVGSLSYSDSVWTKYYWIIIFIVGNGTVAGLITNYTNGNSKTKYMNFSRGSTPQSTFTIYRIGNNNGSPATSINNVSVTDYPNASIFINTYMDIDIKYRFCGYKNSNNNLQPGQVYPSSDTSVDITYPSWPQVNIDPNITTLPVIINPSTDVTLPTAQNPDPSSSEEYSQTIINYITNNYELPKPESNPFPEPEPTDPDPQPDEPAPPIDNDEPNTPDNPPDPNKAIVPDPTPIVNPNVSGLESTNFITIYNPTLAQINELGQHMWTRDFIEALLQSFQNPMDAFISLKQLYMSPTTTTPANIMFGYIDSGVTARVVTKQFCSQSCGSITVEEKYNNATDYPPYVSMQLLLPFIGIVDLDPTDIMGSTLEIRYKCDIYTGTCIAELYVTRLPDLSPTKILYTFTGNCAQELPLTHSSMTGLMSTLLQASTGAITSVAGGMEAFASTNTSGAISTITHNPVHIIRSGSFSANAGILGQRTPQLIISRQHSYDANNYNYIYGYPANSTVYLANCEGFVRVKEINFGSSTATQREKEEIERLLKEGVIL